MTLLEAVNTCLRALGETPVTSVDEQYPTLATILPALDAAVQALLTEGWWFNSFPGYTLLPELDGTVLVPNEMLVFYPDDPARFTFSGRRIVDTATGSITVNSSVVGRAVLLYDFTELAEAAQWAVTYKAAYDVYVSDFGVDNTAQKLQADFAGYYRELGAMHTRQRRASSATKRQTLRWKQKLRN